MDRAVVRKSLIRVAGPVLAAVLAPWRLLWSQDLSEKVKEHVSNAERDLRANDLAGAEAEYRAILSMDSANAEGWTGLGVLLYGTGKTQEATKALHKALAIDPLEKRAELFLGLSEAALGQCDSATPILERHFNSEPVGKLQRLSGLALLACGSSATDVMPALETAAKLKSLYPGDPDVLYEAAELYTRLWNQDAAELITKHPESYRVHELAGEVFEAQGNYDQAIREYKLALEENARLPQMHFRIGQLYLRKGDASADDNAMAEFRAELKVNPQSGVSELAMGEIDRHQHKLDDALAEYRLAAQSDPSLVDARVGVAQVLLEEHQVDASVDQLRAVIKDYPENASAHYVLMLAYRAQGKMAEAGQEMATFKQIQQSSDKQFQDKLNSLLNNRARADSALSR